MIPFVELTSQFKAIEGEVRGAIDGVLERAWFILGEEVSGFELEFSKYVETQHAVGVGSGTDAIQLALLAVGVGSGTEVITVANTCVPTVAGIAATNATPVLVDVDDETLTMDPSRLQSAITDKTRAIVPVHLYGHPCDMNSILAIAKDNGIPVVEDCAQAHGARYRGAPCGSLGTAAAFSFYPSKNLGAYGDGGAVVTNDARISATVAQLRNYGESERYHHDGLGFNSRLDEIQAAILRVKLPYLERWNESRRKLAQLYIEGLAGLPLRPQVEASWATHCRHLFVIRTPDRDRIRAALEARGIRTQLHYPVPVHLQKAYESLGYRAGDFPVSERACNEVLSLPLYPELSTQSVEIVVAAIKNCF